MDPPAIPMINNDEPILVKLPNPLIDSGQRAGHINEFARPSNAIQNTETYPCVVIAMMENITPNTAETINALSCLKYFGIQMIPTM